jgi:integrase
MAIKSYEKNGTVLWSVYFNLRSTKNSKLRLQRRKLGLKTIEEARSEEKQLAAVLSREMIRLENYGACWEEIVDRWEKYKLTFGLDESVSITVNDTAQMLRNWTKIWFGRSAQELNRADGREILQFVKDAGNSNQFLRRLKGRINQVYEWGIEERLITGVHQSPVYGIDIGCEKEHKVPEVLNLDEAKALIVKADEFKHPWASIWKGALLTGMRSGELLALPWTNVELIGEKEARSQETLPNADRSYGLIRVHRTWNGRLKRFGPTKGGFWRTIPVSGELYWFLLDLKKITGKKEMVFRQFGDWQRGMQATILRTFCVSSGLKSIKFHALRASFATLLISEGVAPARVMKICGWKDLKTMQSYIRLSGIDERGATEALHLLPLTQNPRDPEPSKPESIAHEGDDCEADEDLTESSVVVNMSHFRARN